MTTPTHVHTAHCWWNLHEARWVCGAQAADPEAAPDDASAPASDDASAADDAALVDIRDMLVVHTALLREFRLLPGAVARVAADDRSQAAVVDRHLGLLCALLHHHHEGEDTLLWPLLRQRSTPAGVRQLDLVEAQHAQIDTALRVVDDGRARWVATADAGSRDRLVADLRELHALLKAHLDLEEGTVLPLAASLLTEGEWHAVGEAAAAALPKPALVLAFGMFAYEGDPAVLRTMLASAPAVPRVVVPRIAPRAYARRARQVYGTARP